MTKLFTLMLDLFNYVHGYPSVYRPYSSFILKIRHVPLLITTISLLILNSLVCLISIFVDVKVIINHIFQQFNFVVDQATETDIKQVGG